MKLKTVSVGESFSSSEDVDRYRTIYYAGASGDFNPIHIDSEFGRMVGLGGVILHGLCTLGFVAKTLTDWTGDPGSLRKISCRFASPVHPGDTVTTIGRVVDVRDSSVSVDLRVENQESTEVLSRVSAKLDSGRSFRPAEE